MFHYLFNRFKSTDRSNKVLLLISAFAFGFLIIRMIYTQSFRFVFLPWNLFLAFIPYYIARYVQKKEATLPKLKVFGLLTLWWLFLPNAPYIVTDLVHLKLSTFQSVWLDMIIIYLFSIAGLLFGFKSLKIVAQIVSSHLSRKLHIVFVNLVILSCGFGIYLGRIERLNSWDLMIHPFINLRYIANLFIQHDTLINAWSFSMMTGVFLLALYHIFNLFATYEIKEESIS